MLEGLRPREMKKYLTSGSLIQIGSPFCGLTSGNKKSKYVVCSCSCGNNTIVTYHSLCIGTAKSCGCYAKSRNVTHGLTKRRVRSIWRNMIYRCCREENKDYEHYGGRGIKVCDEWMNLLTFVEDMGIPDDSMTLDRIDNNGDYCKDNCRWITNTEQQWNKSSNRILDVDGDSKCVSEWCHILSLNQELVRSRLKYGWTPKEALGLIKRINKKRNKE